MNVHPNSQAAFSNRWNLRELLINSEGADWTNVSLFCLEKSSVHSELPMFTQLQSIFFSAARPLNLSRHDV